MDEKKKITVYIDRDQMNMTVDELEEIMKEEGESEIYETDEVEVTLSE